jgi:PST family polysaccharide transporter
VSVEAENPQPDLKDAAIAGIRWMAVARIASEVIAFVSMVVLARLIIPSEFGEFAIVLVVTEIALTTTGEGIGTALVQRKTVKREHLQAGMFGSICIGLLLGAIAWVTAPYIFTPIFGEGTTELVRLSTPMFLIAAITAVPLAVLQRRLDFRMISVTQIVSTIVRAILTVALALAGLEASALVIGGMIASGSMMLALLVVARLPWPRPRFRELVEIGRFGVPAALAGLSWTGFRNADFAIVGARLGTAGAGFYWRSYQLAIEYQRKVGSGVNQVAFPIYSRAPNVQEMAEFRRRVVRVEAAVLVPCLAALGVLAPLLIPLMFGPTWDDAIVPTQILALAGIVTIPSDTLGPVVLAAGRAKAWLAYHLGCFVVYATAVYIAAGRGLAAVCVAVVVVQAIAAVVGYAALLRGLVEKPILRLWEDMAPGLAGAVGLAAVAAPVAWGLTRIGAPDPVALIVASAAGGVAALAAIRLVSRGAWEDLVRLPKRVLERRRGRTPAMTLAEAR